MSAERHGEKTIAFVLYPGLTLFDLAGPLQVLTALTQIAPEYRTVVVAERGASGRAGDRRTTQADDQTGSGTPGCGGR